jgi:hypothetical protein
MRVVKSVTRVAFPEEQIVVEFQPGLLGRLFGKAPVTVTYEGSGTVWHEFPSGKRASNYMELFLSDASVGHKMKTQSSE